MADHDLCPDPECDYAHLPHRHVDGPEGYGARPEPDPDQDREAAEILAAWDAADNHFDRERLKIELTVSQRDHAARTADALERLATAIEGYADLIDAWLEAFGDGGHAK